MFASNFFLFCILDLTEMTTKNLTTSNENLEKLKNDFQSKLINLAWSFISIVQNVSLHGYAYYPIEQRFPNLFCSRRPSKTYQYSRRLNEAKICKF